MNPDGDDPLPVVVYGAGGYGGVGLVENLLEHRRVRISALVSREGADAPYAKLYPHLEGRVDLPVEHADRFEPAGRGRFVFFSTPDGVGQGLARKYLQAGYRIIDFSGDFRFRDAAMWQEYAGRQTGAAEHACPELLPTCVYGVPELHRAHLRGAQVAGNPGCMAVGCLLAMAPAFREKLVEPAPVVCAVLTGISGAGKKPKAGFHFPAAAANAYAYKVCKHQHVMELERELAALSGRPVRVDFVPHVIPAVRGIVSTCRLQLAAGVTRERVEAAYRAAYASEPFVRVDFSGRAPELADVRGANLCRMSLHLDPRTGALVVVSAIDNLQKGQAGNAVQAMNVMCGFPEGEGLAAFPRYP